MKARLSLLFCLVTFPFFIRAQTNVVPSAKAVQDKELEELLSKPIVPEQLALRAQEQRGLPDSPSSWTAWTAAPWDAPVQETLPTVSLGHYDVHASGLAVNAFGPAAPDRSWAERVFGTNIAHPFVSEPLAPRPPIKYFKWGERDAPWSTVGESRQPSGVFLSFHF
jgi:hypothetical protein